MVRPWKTCGKMRRRKSNKMLVIEYDPIKGEAVVITIKWKDEK